MKLLDFLKDRILVLDGGMGTLLQARGLLPGELPERWNLSHPEVIREIHRAYYDAGSHVVSTNTFGASVLKFGEDELERIVCAAIDCARRAQRESTGKQPKWVHWISDPSDGCSDPTGILISRMRWRFLPRRFVSVCVTARILS